MPKILPDQVILLSKGGDTQRFTQSNQRNKHYTNKGEMHIQTHLFFPP